ncbi:MAG TPA: sodium/solute symporter, partial [Gemmataceae bacterium]|nr:sodium/solute symporter [Gemmataceae bacterium]
FVGDRNVAWWLVLVSIVATETSTVTFLSIPGKGFSGNLTFLQLTFGYIVGRILIALLLLPQYLRGELFSAYQLLKARFDVRVQRTASALFLITRTVADGLRLWLTGLLLQQFTGWDIATSVLVLGGVTIVYTYLGGMEAVIWTDLVQFVIYIAGAILAGWFMLHMLPGHWSEFVAVNKAAGKFHLIEWGEPLTNPQTFLTGLIGGAFVTMASHGADQNMVQRYLCARSLRSAQAALISSGFVVALQFLLFLLIGEGLSALTTAGVLSLPAETRTDAVFGYFIVHALPTGLIGLVVAAVLASAMASFSSSLNSAANAVVADFYRPLRPHHSDRTYLRIAKAMTSVVGVAKVSVALLCIPLMNRTVAVGSRTFQIDRSVVDQVLAVASVTLGLILGLFFLGSLRRPVRSGAALFGLLAGFAVAGGLWVWWAQDNSVLAWPWLAPAGTVTTTITALIVNAVGAANVAGSPANRSP